MAYNLGDIITFSYNAPSATDKKPIVLVIAPMFDGFLHGINLKYVPEKEREMFLRIVHPDYHSKIGNYVEKIPALKKVLDRRKRDQSITAFNFYHLYVKGFVSKPGFNAYRKYKHDHIFGTFVIDLDKFKV